MVAGVLDGDEAVQRVALSALGQAPTDAAARSPPVAQLLGAHESWAMRVLAAQALGRLGKAGQRRGVGQGPAEAATKDAYALVREAALGALASFDAKDAPAARARRRPERRRAARARGRPGHRHGGAP